MNSWEYLPYIYEPNSRFFIFLVVNNYISFIEMKNLLGLNCQYVSQNTRTNFVVVTGGCLLHTLHYTTYVVQLVGEGHALVLIKVWYSSSCSHHDNTFHQRHNLRHQNIHLHDHPSTPVGPQKDRSLGCLWWKRNVRSSQLCRFPSKQNGWRHVNR